MNQKLLISLALTSVMFGGTRYAKADLTGSTITGATYCCDSPTNPADLLPETQQTGTVPVIFTATTVSGGNCSTHPFRSAPKGDILGVFLERKSRFTGFGCPSLT
jgi:hypothetical protein